MCGFGRLLSSEVTKKVTRAVTRGIRTSLVGRGIRPGQRGYSDIIYKRL